MSPLRKTYRQCLSQSGSFTILQLSPVVQNTKKNLQIHPYLGIKGHERSFAQSLSPVTQKEKQSIGIFLPFSSQLLGSGLQTIRPEGVYSPNIHKETPASARSLWKLQIFITLGLFTSSASAPPKHNE